MTSRCDELPLSVRNTQVARVLEVLKMSPGFWTLRSLAVAVNASEAGVSARLRDLRKPRYGGHTIERKRLHGRVYGYALGPNQEGK